jgi:hypothetical protein
VADSIGERGGEAGVQRGDSSTGSTEVVKSKSDDESMLWGEGEEEVRNGKMEGKNLT